MIKLSVEGKSLPITEWVDWVCKEIESLFLKLKDGILVNLHMNWRAKITTIATQNTSKKKRTACPLYVSWFLQLGQVDSNFREMKQLLRKAQKLEGCHVPAGAQIIQFLSNTQSELENVTATLKTAADCMATSSTSAGEPFFSCIFFNLKAICLNVDFTICQLISMWYFQFGPETCFRKYLM